MEKLFLNEDNTLNAGGKKLIYRTFLYCIIHLPYAILKYLFLKFVFIFKRN